MRRRTFLQAGAGVLGTFLNKDRLTLAARTNESPLHFNYSICNEVFENWEFAPTCRAIREAGFKGIEISPFTLASHVDDISPSRRRELRDIMSAEGVAFVGMHWLLVSPKGLHVTTPDKVTREKSWEYLGKLIELCADLGSNGVMVFGSPKQRGTQGNSREEATGYLTEGLSSLAPHADARGVTILLEALPRKDTDVVNTLEEAVQIVKQIGQPSIQTMFDFHNFPDEKTPFDQLVSRYYSYIRHIHVNEMDGRYPGTGHLDYRPVFQVLADRKYSRWVSLEVFDFKPGPLEIVQATMKYYRGLEPRLKF